MCPVAVAEIVITSVIALLPTSSLGAPWYKGFGFSSLKYVNYTPVVVGGRAHPAVDLAGTCRSRTGSPVRR